MCRKSRGGSTVEFALALPIVIALMAPAFQLGRVALLQMRLDSLAFHVCRRLATETSAADLSILAGHLIGPVRPDVSFRVERRKLVNIPVAFPRRPRSIEIIEIDLAAPGPRIAARPTTLRAHARECRWEPVI